MTTTTTQDRPTATIRPVYVAGNATIHAGRKIGTYDSGADRFAKVCGGAGRDRHDPMPVDDETTAVTCKRCLSKMPAPPTDALVEAVFEHATANYTRGWDVVVETMTPAEVAETINGATTPAAAIAAIAEIVGLHEEQKSNVLAQSGEHEEERAAAAANADAARQLTGDDEDVKKAIEAASIAAGGATVTHDPETGETETLPATIGDVVRDALRNAARALNACEAAEVDPETPATDEQIKRGTSRAKPGLVGKARGVWIITGEDSQAQATRARLAREAKAAASASSSTSTSTTRRRSSSRDTTKVDDVDTRAAVAGTEAAGAKGKPLSQRVSAKEAAKARAVLLTIAGEQIAAGKWPNLKDPTPAFIVEHYVPHLLGFTSEKAMRAYVDGSETALKPDAKAGVKALTKGIASHQVWARKAAAAAFGVGKTAK